MIIKLLRSSLAVVLGYILAVFVSMLVVSFLFPESTRSSSSLKVAVGLIAVLIGSLGAGIVTALISGRSPVVHALVVAVFVAIVGLILMVSGAGVEPLWYSLASLVVQVPAIVGGGILKSRRTVTGDD